MLDDYRPLLEEKGFRVEIRLADETVFTDRRGLCFLLGQLVSNSVKYTGDAPVLTLCRLRVLRGGLRRKGPIPPKLGAYSLFNRLLVLVVGQRQSPLYGHLRRFGDGLRA